MFGFSRNFGGLMKLKALLCSIFILSLVACGDDSKHGSGGAGGGTGGSNHLFEMGTAPNVNGNSILGVWEFAPQVNDGITSVLRIQVQPTALILAAKCTTQAGKFIFSEVTVSAKVDNQFIVIQQSSEHTETFADGDRTVKCTVSIQADTANYDVKNGALSINGQAQDAKKTND